jgi:hypothetical protein
LSSVSECVSKTISTGNVAQAASRSARYRSAIG